MAATRWFVVFLTIGLAVCVSLAEGQDDGSTNSGQTLPTIDCPLRKAGIDPSKLKPFEEVEDYIRFLERADRAKWQKPAAVIEELNLSGSETIADVGAGSGYFTFRFSKTLTTGKVIAIDSQPEMVRHIHRKARTNDIANVTAQVAASDDPRLPADAHIVFVCDVLMHVKNRPAWLKTIHQQMKLGSRLVLIDFKQGELPEGPPESIKVSKSRIIQLCSDAGFLLQADHAKLLPYQEFLVFRKQ